MSSRGAGQERAARRAESLRERDRRPGRTARRARPLAGSTRRRRSRAAPRRGRSRRRAPAPRRRRARLPPAGRPPAHAVVRVLDLDERRGRIHRSAPAAFARPGTRPTVKTPRAPISVNWTPEFAAEPPVSCQTAWLSRLTMTSSPGRVRTRRATWFAIVPLGSQSAASLPRSAAVRSWRRFIVGSSPYSSLPTGRGGHGRSHGRRRQRDGVRAEVDGGDGLCHACSSENSAGRLTSLPPRVSHGQVASPVGPRH